MKISAPPSALEPAAASVRFDPVAEPPGPTDANPDVGETIRVQDLPLPASIRALRAGARNGSRSRSQLDDSASDTEAAPGAGRSGRGTTRAGASPSDPAQATAVASPPPPSRPSEYTGEAPVGQQWLSQRHRYLQALRADLDAQRAAAMASPGGPGWVDAPMSTNESGQQQYAGPGDVSIATAPDGRTVVFDEAAWRAHYAATLDARGVLVATALANLYGADTMNGLDAVVRAQLIDLAAATGSQVTNAGPAPAGRAMGDAAQLAQLDQYLAQPQIRELIELYGGAPPAATSDLAREQVRLYGQARFEHMGRLANAMAHVREEYRRAFEQAQAAGQGAGWIERTSTVATTDEYGAASEVTVTRRVFDADAFTAAYGAQSGAANRAFRDLYGASQSTTSTSEAGGESTSYTITHTSTTFADSGWVAEDGVMTHRDLLGLDPNTARLRDNRAVGFDVRAGWVTSQANVDRGRSFFDRIADALPLPSFGSGPLMMPPGFTAQDPLGRAVLGGVQEQLQFPGQMVQNLITNAGRPWDALRGGGEAGLAHLINAGARGALAAGNVLDTLIGQNDERRLSPEEIQSLRRVYGDTIDYGAVRVRRGGVSDSVTSRPYVVDNTIWMPEKYFGADGKLTNVGLTELVHEAAHVWQYQHRGPGYLGEALAAQARYGNGLVGTGGAYDWVAELNRGKSFETMNVEAQGEMAKYIWLGYSGDTFSRSTLETALQQSSLGHDFHLSEAQWQEVLRAKAMLAGG